MSGAINNTNINITPAPVTSQNEKSTNTVSQQDADDFASQMNAGDTAAEGTTEEVQRDEVLDLMKQNAFKQFHEQQKERQEEMKKNFE
ncbi:MAG: hypothetical protein OXC48_01475 [Endozoicomonadaceae bacterium]|nr:hypothetical protein [Endozoicomonadaceae bacterium]